MRIIAGTHRGHRIQAPPGLDTRPTSDRVRENVFNLVGPLDGAAVLDLYAGSGAMGLEALSRGSGPGRLRRARPRGGADDRAEPRQAPPAGDDRPAGRAHGACERGGNRQEVRSRAGRPALRHVQRTPTQARALPAVRARRPTALLVVETSARDRARAAAHRSARAASTARRGSPSTTVPRDHRDLSRVVRPGHERPHRRDHARVRHLRPRRRRRRRQSAPQAADVHDRRAHRVPARRARASRATSRSTSSASSSSTSRSGGRRRRSSKGCASSRTSSGSSR